MVAEDHRNIVSGGIGHGGVADGVLYVRGKRFVVRDLVVGGAMAALLAACLALTISLVVVAGRAPPAAARSCKTAGCIRYAAVARDYMNDSRAPCDDFFQYACAGYGRRHGIHPQDDFRSTAVDALRRNERRLHVEIWKDVQRYDRLSWEKKLKYLFRSCMDVYTIQNLRGRPLVDVIVASGGWNVLTPVRPATNATWGNNREQLKQMQSKYRVSPMFGVEIHESPISSKANVIQLKMAGLGMEYRHYLERTEMIQLAYQTFIRSVGMLVAKDAGMNHTDPSQEVSFHVDRFAEEVYYIETQIANATAKGYQGKRNQMITLADLKSTVKMIDWVGILSAMFPDEHLTDQTQLMLDYEDYFGQLDYILRNVLRNTTTGARILNNYMVWRMMQSFVPALSTDYRSTAFDLEVALRGSSESKSRWETCFSEIVEKMPLALSALYMRTVGEDFAGNRKLVNDAILPSILDTLNKHIDSLTWMDGATKSAAREKISKMKHIIGFSEEWIKDSAVDETFKELSVSREQFFENCLAWRRYERWTNRFLLKNGALRQKWKLNLWATQVDFYHTWNELIVPAGALEEPLVRQDLPMVVNMATLGSRMARSALTAVDIFGGHFAADGSVTHWWTQTTTLAYVKKWDCFVQYWNNTETGPWLVEGSHKSVKVNGARFGRHAISDHAGLKYAFSAYKGAQKQTFRPIPGFEHLSSDQLFFLAYAQSHCFSQRQVAGYEQARRGIVPLDKRINGALRHFSEFSRSYSCPADSRMVTKPVCDVF